MHPPPVAAAAGLDLYIPDIASEPAPAPPKGGRDWEQIAGMPPVARRYLLQSAARELAPGLRVAGCMRLPVAGAVTLSWSDSEQRASWSGLRVCGSPWACPVCAARISEGRARELESAIRAARKRGWTVYFATITIRHYGEDSLRVLLPALEAGWRWAWSGRWLAGGPATARAEAQTGFRARHGVQGYVRALELTWGRETGWHPHQHLLLFCAAATSAEAIQADLTARWTSACNRAGSRLHRLDRATAAVDVRAADGDGAMAAYLAKGGDGHRWGAAREAVKGQQKLGHGGVRYSPVELLALHLAHGETEASVAWRDYAAATYGRHQIQWSRRLRTLLLGSEESPSDLDLATAAPRDRTCVAILGKAAWAVVLGHDARADVLLALTIDGGAPARALALLAALGVSRPGP